MDLSSILGWGSPVGIGILMLGVGTLWSGWARLRTAYKDKH